MLKIKVTFAYMVYENKTNGWCCIKYRNHNQDENGLRSQVICTGTALPSDGGTYILECEESMSPKYGKTYKVSSFSPFIEENRDSILAYLCSPMMKGVGKKTAQKIYAAFGNDTLNVFEEDPDRLYLVPGITRKKADTILECYRNSRVTKDLMLLLNPLGFSQGQINRIYAKYQNNSLYQCQKHPYDLCSVRGISFHLADKLALSMGVDRYHIKRIFEAVKFIIYELMANGDTCVSQTRLEKEMIRVLDCPEVNPSSVNNLISFLVSRNCITRVEIDGEDRLQLPSVREVEETIAMCLKGSMGGSMPPYDGPLEIPDGIILDESQERAVRMAISSPVSIITGGPGTGKTTIMKIIAQTLESMGKKDLMFLSPTGKAARRITESTGYPAFTIHRALNLGVDEGSEISRYVDIGETIQADAVFVDEVSMLDIWVAEKLFSSILTGNIILVGDIDQLPSVRSGAVLRDLIRSGKIPVARLELTHRSDSSSKINENAHRIKAGDGKLQPGDDFHIIKVPHTEDAEYLQEIEDQMVECYIRAMETYGIENVVCLCPFKKYPAGVFSVNNRIQSILNPPSPLKPEMLGLNGQVFRAGDIVIQCRNAKDVANGEVGIVSDIRKENGFFVMDVMFSDDRSAVYSRENIDELMLGYAMTVHKSQGSEYDCVITCLSREHSVMLKRNIPYTAVTRAKKNVFLFCDDAAVDIAVSRDDTDVRKTVLQRII